MHLQLHFHKHNYSPVNLDGGFLKAKKWTRQNLMGPKTLMKIQANLLALHRLQFYQEYDSGME